SETPVAEQRDLSFDILAQRTLRATDENIGLNSDLHELAHGVLGGLGLHLARGGDEWPERQVNKQRVLATDLGAELSNGLEEWERFDVADRAADLDDHDVVV